MFFSRNSQKKTKTKKQNRFRRKTVFFPAKTRFTATKKKTNLVQYPRPRLILTRETEVFKPKTIFLKKLKKNTQKKTEKT